MIDLDRLTKLLGERVRQIREAQPGMSQEALADVLELQRTSVTNIEGGRQKLTLEALYRLCDHFSLEPYAVLPRLEDVRVADELHVVEHGGARLQVTPKTADLIHRLKAQRPSVEAVGE